MSWLVMTTLTQSWQIGQSHAIATVTESDVLRLTVHQAQCYIYVWDIMDMYIEHNMISEYYENECVCCAKWMLLMWCMDKMSTKGLGASTTLAAFHVRLLWTRIISSTNTVMNGISFFKHGTFCSKCLPAVLPKWCEKAGWLIISVWIRIRAWERGWWG